MPTEQEVEHNRTIKRVIFEFDLAVQDERKKSRIIEDNAGIWRIQSLTNRMNEKAEFYWRDEYGLDSEYPACYPVVVQNIDSILKAVYKHAKEK
jgi:hypothetical protein